MIAIQNLTKRYRSYRLRSDWLKERIFRRKLHETITAVDNVSFNVGEGEVVGVIGRNGAGKSSLLKLVMGVLLPDSGTIMVAGRVTGLLELGTGFNPEMSGYDNIDFNASLLGLSPDEIKRKRQNIIEFSELATSIQHPLRTYSSGMTMRLAFSIAIHADPACFVVDEALSVGDIQFQQKCMRRIREFRKTGGSILFVSHDLNAVKILCDRALLLENGAVAASGHPETVVNDYNRLLAADRVVDGQEAPEETREGYGTREAEIEFASVVGETSGGAVMRAGEFATITIGLRGNKHIEDVTLGIMIRDRFGQDIYGTNTHFLSHELRFDKNKRCISQFRMQMNLSPGHYTITVALHSEDHHLDACYHWRDRLLQFEVAGFLGPKFGGVCRLDPIFSVEWLDRRKE